MTMGNGIMSRRGSLDRPRQSKIWGDDTSFRDGTRRSSKGRSVDAGIGLSDREVRMLVEGLDSAHAQSRRVVFNALRQLGQAASPILVRALGDPRAVVRQDVMNLLRLMRSDVNAAVGR